MKIGVFGGSFDPIHTGHAMVANYIAQCCGLDEVWLMPGRINPLKISTPPASGEHRLAMCRLVARHCRNVGVSDIELTLPAPSYTYITLGELERLHPGFQFRLIIGSDNWNCFSRWRNSEEIIRRWHPIIFPRPGHDVDPDSLPQGVTLVPDCPVAAISSTFIREGLTKGMNLEFFLPHDVIEYIKSNHLYEQHI